MRTQGEKKKNLTCSRESRDVHMLHGVPEAPRVGPKYYTQTVAITSKPEIPHSTFLIPAARLLSWAPHEQPLLGGEGSCISLCLSVCLQFSQLSVSLSLRPYISHCHNLSVTLCCLSFYRSLRLFIFHLSYVFLCCPLSNSVFPSVLHFVYFSLPPPSLSPPRPASPVSY